MKGRHRRHRHLVVVIVVVDNVLAIHHRLPAGHWSRKGGLLLVRRSMSGRERLQALLRRQGPILQNRFLL